MCWQCSALFQTNLPHALAERLGVTVVVAGESLGLQLVAPQVLRGRVGLRVNLRFPKVGGELFSQTLVWDIVLPLSAPRSMMGVVPAGEGTQQSSRPYRSFTTIASGFLR